MRLVDRPPDQAGNVNLVIVLVGWRALTTLPVQQYPKIESSSVVITTVYYGASAETVRGFLGRRNATLMIGLPEEQREAAVEALFGAMTSLDVRRVIGLLPPDEIVAWLRAFQMKC